MWLTLENKSKTENISNVVVTIPLFNINQSKAFNIQPIEIKESNLETRFGIFKTSKIQSGQKFKIIITYSINNNTEKTEDINQFSIA